MFKIITINPLRIKNIAYLLLLLFLFIRPVYAVQIEFTANKTILSQGDQLTLTLRFIPEDNKDKNCHLFAYNDSNNKNHPIFFEKEINEGKLKFEGTTGSWLYTATSKGEISKSTMTFSIIGKDSFDLTPKIRTYSSLEFGLPDIYSSTKKCIPNRLTPPITLHINKKTDLTSNPQEAKGSHPPSNDPEEVQALTCKTLEDRFYLTEDLSVAEKDSFIIKNLSGDEDKDDLNFYISNCKDKGSDRANQIRDRNFEPEELATQSDSILASATKQLGNIRSRLDKLRTSDGKRGVDISGATLNIQGQKLSGNLLGGGAGDDNGLIENSRWGFFTNGEYGFGSRNRTSDLSVGSGDRNFDFNSQGLTVGADYRFPGEKVITGGAIGYKNFDSFFTTQEGGINTQGVNISAYGTYLISEKSYLDVVVGYGEDKINSQRPVNNDGTGDIGKKTTFAIGKPNANTLSFSAGAGYEFTERAWSLIPYGRMDYSKANIEAYKETPSHLSAKSSMLTINKQDTESLSSILGLKTSRVISTSKGVLIPQASLEWKHEFKEGTPISGQLYNDQPFSETNRSKLTKDQLSLGIGFSTVLPKGRSTFLTLESRIGDAVITDNVLKAGFRWEFGVE